MSGSHDFAQIAETSAIYAGFARAFVYPEHDQGVLSKTEYLESFDPSACSDASSVREASYANIEASALFEELVRYYEYFGLSRSQDAELPDHLSIELEFMHFLCELERHAPAGSADTDSLHKAQRDFIERHVLRLLTGLQQARNGKQERADELVRSCAEFVELHRLALSDTN